MSYNDFVTNYHKIEICNLGPDSPQDESGVKKRWEATVHEGSWVSRVNAGGCRNFLGETELINSMEFLLLEFALRVNWVWCLTLEAILVKELILNAELIETIFF